MCAQPYLICFRGDQVDAEVAFSSMLARRQELNTQLQQLIDSVLLALSLLAAHALRYYSTAWFNLTTPIDPFRNYKWLLVVVIAVGRILLDLQGLFTLVVHKPD